MKKTIILFSILMFTSLTFGQSVIIKDAANDILMVVADDGDVGIGTTNPQGILDLTSTLGALIVPRMTSAQRDALPEINGSIIYNTTTEKFNFRENGTWLELND